ncbi:mitochondrial ribosomal protein L23 precursor, putative [Plasmodium berghei]|uniref:Large ribosomal subunit protein uL23m n=2 Tax=Plasmodium berghei TaxID=5821 RepID=A0A509AR78_PLABA|nr:mitochondrial ribosomal protein L23 precursor, putative [Plasmodium berghei ANKA]CXJ26722.1 mitochondrial ribosomal protein L23 precursor, putative [Plasmodium berghei]SCM26947.1 mitochondrial ribosomal protein L23 precursor, putative [Plasmodium berghei]SCN28717.1 mitochondrial ribosomal protein L23 precursor, putative [Plasmodium berghei]SCO62965.1 mitochondrial ribosomal protein L23 precursor, putative [Plasmodium berghei]SCO64464.1 mitochondrial ribosomal protein L23 precursor, putative|eukprot:XP_034424363.1 mitochondrial ribosomal protein L23 precursor, putative [Plasmodium berghei ANKA]
MFLSLIHFTPPKTPRNVFFPWQTFCVHKSGSFLEKNRLALRVPINLTKFEIREYLRKIYNAKVIKVNTLIKIPERRRNLSDHRFNYYRNGPIYKKAIITLEHEVPDSVKMIQSCKNIGRNPYITKKNVIYGVRSDVKITPTRSQLWHMGECRYSWRLPLTNLLADYKMNLNPDLRIDENYVQLAPDPTKPFMHSGVSSETFKPDNVPDQTFPHINLTPWRRHVKKIYDSGTLAPPESFHHVSKRGETIEYGNQNKGDRKSARSSEWKPPS